MGTSSAPTYANIMMGVIDKKMKQLATGTATTDPINLLKSFIDDYFLIWIGSVEDLITFLEDINSLHPTLKFTSSFTCPFPCLTPVSTPHDCFCHSTRSIAFTQVSIREGQLIIDLLRKPRDRCMYLLPSSCHPAHITITNNISYSLCVRLVRFITTIKSYWADLMS